LQGGREKPQYPFPREDAGGFFHQSSGYNEGSIDNRSALYYSYSGDIEGLRELGPLI